MKKPVVVFASSLFLLVFFSCSNPTKSLNDKDADLFSDVENTFEEDQSFDDTQIYDFDESDEDIDDSDNEFHGLSFKTRPHGITRWDETYSYFIRCESEKGLRTIISVSGNDTCRGQLLSFGFSDLNTYSFTPVKKEFPDGRCIIAIECSDGENRITQKTHIQIPNPFQLPDPVGEEPVFRIYWSNDQRFVFKYQNKIYSINRSLDSITLLDDNVLEYITCQSSTLSSQCYVKEKFFYYISKNRKYIMKTNGLPEETVAVKMPDIINIVSIVHVYDDENMLLLSFDDATKKRSLWFYNSLNNAISLIETPQDFNDCYPLCDNNRCVFYSKNSEPLLFHTSTKNLEKICADSVDHGIIIGAFLNDKIYYRKNYEKCLTSLNIISCEEEKVGNCESEAYTSALFISGQNFFHTSHKENDRTEITLIKHDGNTQSAIFNEYPYDFKTIDGTHLYAKVEKTGETDEPYKSIKIFNIKNGSVTIPELTTDPFGSMLHSGFIGEAAFYIKTQRKFFNQYYEVNNDGTVTHKSLKTNVAPSLSSFSFLANSGDDDFYTLNSGQIFKTDGTLEGTTHIKNVPGSVISLSDNHVAIHSGSLDVYNLETNEIISSNPTKACSIQSNPKSDPEITYSGFEQYPLKFKNLSFFGIHKDVSCGNYKLFSSNGIKGGTVDHEIILEPLDNLIINKNIFSDMQHGFYLSLDAVYYIDMFGSKAFHNDLLEYRVLGMVDNKCIAYKIQYGKIPEIVVLENGKIINRIQPPEGIEFSNISMTGKRVQLLEIVRSEKGHITNILFFPDGDLKKEPVKTKFFDGGFNSVEKLLEKEKTSVYSIPFNNDRAPSENLKFKSPSKLRYYS